MASRTPSSAFGTSTCWRRCCAAAGRGCVRSLTGSACWSARWPGWHSRSGTLPRPLARWVPGCWEGYRGCWVSASCPIPCPPRAMPIPFLPHCMSTLSCVRRVFCPRYPMPTSLYPIPPHSHPAGHPARGAGGRGAVLQGPRLVPAAAQPQPAGEGHRAPGECQPRGARGAPLPAPGPP